MPIVLVGRRPSLGPQAPSRLSVNLSRRQFALPDLEQRIASTLEHYRLPPSQLQLEVTEDALAGDVTAAVRSLQALKKLGVDLVIDEFGAGTSSFASLHQFPVDVLRIHRSLLTGIERSKDIASMIHGLAVMVKNLGIDMVAEGVESSQQVIALQELGCEFAQGLLFAPPLTGKELQQFASRNLGLECSTCRAATYAHQWGDHLAVYEAIDWDER